MTVLHIILIYMCQNAGVEFLPVSLLRDNLHRYERKSDHGMQSRSDCRLNRE
jgi:hypothetical protein